MKKPASSEAASADNPEWTDAMFAKAKRGKAAATRSVGRPKKQNPKIQATLRYSPEVIAYFKGTGDGWQTRMDEVLKDYVQKRVGRS